MFPAGTNEAIDEEQRTFWRQQMVLNILTVPPFFCLDIYAVTSQMSLPSAFLSLFSSHMTLIF